MLLLSALCCLGLSQGILDVEEEGTGLPPWQCTAEGLSVLTDVILGQYQCLLPVVGWFTSQEISSL